MDKLNMPLMDNNIEADDFDVLINFLKEKPIMTQNKNVRAFEKEWSEWLGVKYSVFVNSGSSANLLSMAAMKHLYGDGEIIVPTLTWVSDISSVLYCGFEPVFVDIDPKSLAMSEQKIIDKITDKTKAVFLTHILGFNGLTDNLIKVLEEKNIPLIEDVCESHGATHNGKRLGSIGLMSNFSFYYAHHMTTVEGGMICTNDERLYEHIRMLRSHGMVRELDNEDLKREYWEKYPDLNPDFIFSYPGFNVRSSEMNAVLGRHQLKKLDENNAKRVENCKTFYENLDSKKFRTDFNLEGAVNYAFVLLLNEKDDALMEKVSSALKGANVEFRRGTSGGGNQLRQPYLRSKYENLFNEFPEVDHVHFYGMYIGNFPSLSKEKIIMLCELLNNVV